MVSEVLRVLIGGIVKTLENLSVHPLPEEVTWLLAFRKKVESGMSPTGLAHGLVHLGVSDPANQEEDVLDCSPWFVLHQAEYNRAVREIIDAQPGLRAKIRRVLREDLKVEGTSESYGKIVRKDYGCDLLEHFLHLTPNPAWVG
ncbi:MAG: hypothetical protein NUV81_00055 [bacterium]|nr:hypothetical protein [bacterium]